MNDTGNDILTAINHAIRTSARKGSLTHEFTVHFAAYSKLFDGRQNDWDAVAAVCEAKGFRGRKGQPLTALAVRKVYERVRRQQRGKGPTAPERPDPAPTRPGRTLLPNFKPIT
jgi:hypothetical protein